MCGITGAYYFKHNTATSTQIEASLVALRQRGPDNAGSFTDEKVFLGHTRLSIIDVSAAANQPFTDLWGCAAIEPEHIFIQTTLKMLGKRSDLKSLPSITFYRRCDPIDTCRGRLVCWYSILLGRGC